MKLIFATGNPHKLQEAGEILGPAYSLSMPKDHGLHEDMPETGNTLKNNSLQKASFIYENLGSDCFADDSGLEVDALGGAPGVYTARYAAGGTRFADNLDKLLFELDGEQNRTARFHAVITLILGGDCRQFDGICEGRISTVRKGSGGFGYDPVFIPSELPVLNGDGSVQLIPNTEGLTMAEIPEGDKNIISHRGRALRAMAGHLESLGQE